MLAHLETITVEDLCLAALLINQVALNRTGLLLPRERIEPQMAALASLAIVKASLLPFFEQHLAATFGNEPLDHRVSLL